MDMRFFTVLTFALPAVLAMNQYDMMPGSLKGSLKGFGKILKFLNIDLSPKANFTANDLAKIGAKLMETDALKSLIVDEVVSFNLTDLSVPEKEAEEALVASVMTAKDGLQRFIANKISNKTDASMLEDTKKQIRMALDAIAKVENFEQKAKARVDAVFARNPQYADIIRFTIMALPDVSNKQVLDYVKLFFSVANESNPEEADKIVSLLEALQLQYNLFPEDFYALLQAAAKGDAY